MLASVVDLERFQSTHPRGVRRSPRCRMRSRPGFNPRTHEGCDPLAHLCSRCCSCFNPRTHEGCDLEIDTPMKLALGFNPRTHEGCDTGLRSWWQPWQSFNPRTHEGCDNGRPACGIDEFSSFNPRTHEGCDTMCGRSWSTITSFNPRTHEGCDELPGHTLTNPRVSIHAPTRGATQFKQLTPKIY